VTQALHVKKVLQKFLMHTQIQELPKSQEMVWGGQTVEKKMSRGRAEKHEQEGDRWLRG
jgi:hypothetical protein